MRNGIIFATIFTLLFVAITSGCGNAAAPAQPGSNSTAVNASNDHAQTMIAHSTENQPPPGANNGPSGTRTKWSQSGNPIDTRELDAAVSNAERAMKAKPADAAATKALSGAYFRRAFALTDARQYASALGDYRRSLKLDPSNADAKQWMDQILQIYDSMNKEAPKDGEEPPPLPYKKGENNEK